MYYLCRKHESKAWVPKSKPAGSKRRKLTRDPLGCGIRIKTVTFALSVTVTRTGEWLAYCYKLELLNHQKKNSGIMALALRRRPVGIRSPLLLIT